MYFKLLVSSDQIQIPVWLRVNHQVTHTYTICYASNYKGYIGDHGRSDAALIVEMWVSAFLWGLSCNHENISLLSSCLSQVNCGRSAFRMTTETQITVSLRSCDSIHTSDHLQTIRGLEYTNSHWGIHLSLMCFGWWHPSWHVVRRMPAE